MICYSFDMGPNEAGDCKGYDSDNHINSGNDNNGYVVDDLEIVRLILWTMCDMIF